MVQTVAVIDYGSGNLHSVTKAIENAGTCRVIVTSDAPSIHAADRVVLPGVGAMGDCMQGLKDRGLDSVVLDVITTKPLMGICVGMQILAEYGEESSGVNALGVFPGQIRQFSKSMKTDAGDLLKVPHMGWNEVVQVPHPMWSGISDRTRFYFVHSYCYADAGADCVIGWCEYGPLFGAALARQNVFAVQFHPEKSHDAGIHLYSNFLSWDGAC
ncbi:MAG: imidazole glycerol phosphate synthase subunit HisH [Gammaproteobacteria bacterium]|nr:imidazole glycerol phosphate synthase subunit HisH [Gammaproteobacteria bacterium]|tara:strand:- start:8076 stop:8717 length:642 start_codon:yes stop_codon:yes gene_type:complete